MNLPKAHFHSLPFQQHLVHLPGEKMGFLHVRTQGRRGMGDRAPVPLKHCPFPLPPPIGRGGRCPKAYRWCMVNHPSGLHAVHLSPFSPSLLFPYQ